MSLKNARAEERRGKVTSGPTPHPGPFAFEVVLRLSPEGPEVFREPITGADLSEMHGEAWLAYLRKGRPDVGLEELKMRLLPVPNAKEGRICKGLLLHATGPDGQTTECSFDIEAVAHVAERGARRLVNLGTLKQDALYYYHVVAEEQVERVVRGPARGRPEIGSFKHRRKPLVYRTLPLAPLVSAGQELGHVDGWCPVLYTRDVFDRAEKFSRRGAECEKPQESGGVFLGSLCSCPDTGEFYVLVSDVIEVTDAEHSAFSLTYSAQTWTRIQAVVKRKQEDPATRGERIVGQCHGHNFKPDYGRKSCDNCEKQPACMATSVFVSQQDLIWSKSVFARQPWAFCHIFGMDARGGRVDGQFGFRGGRMEPRGFYLLEEFPEAPNTKG